MAWDKEIEVCRSVALRAGELALRMRERGVEREDKPDDSPVTAADRACEELIVAELSRAFPDDGFLGEEGAARESRSGRRWIVDPIDGTRDFVRGLPGWCNLIALEADGEIVAGTCFMAALGELYWAAKGKGAWLGERPIRISSVTRKDQSVLCLTALSDLARAPFAHRTADFLSGFWAVRSLGGCYDAVQVIAGRAEGWIEMNAKAWDLAPFKILAQESGARFFGFDGEARIDAGNAIVCVPALEEELAAFVRNERGV